MNWLVIGGGVSGFGAALLLRKFGQFVRISDQGPVNESRRARLTGAGVEVRDGGHHLDHVTGIDRVVVSPGIAGNHPLIVETSRRGLPLISEIDLALEHFRGTVIGVTGTNGKSTTCAMIGHVLAKAGVNVGVGGNFGDPPSLMLAEGRAPEVLVLELSSYQLEQSRLIRPHIAVFTSFSIDHTARHGSLAAYFAAKWRIFLEQAPGDLAVLPGWILEKALSESLPMPPSRTIAMIDAAAAARPRLPAATNVCVLKDGLLTTSTGESVNLAQWGISLHHNQVNAALTLETALHLGAGSATTLGSHLADFKGLRHRCEFVGKFSQYSVVNDSKSTNVESTLVALGSQAKPVLLMLGGIGKGEPYAPLLEQKERIAGVVTFGRTGAEIAAALTGQLPTFRFETLSAAMDALAEVLARAGHPKTILFSPACASFDEFKSYEHRGDYFVSRIREIFEPADQRAERS